MAKNFSKKAGIAEQFPSRILVCDVPIRIGSKRGFTLVEVLIATALIALVVVGAMGGIHSLAAADARARTADLLQRMAMQKINELGAVTDPGSAAGSGDFSDNGYPDITWTVDVQAAGLDNLDKVTVVAKRGTDSQSLTELIYVPPLTGTTGAPGT